MHTIDDFLQKVRSRPSMFTVDLSLITIEDMLHGYSAALQAHGIDEPGRDFNHHFADFVYDKLGWSMSNGWARAITRTSAKAPSKLI
jgi:hypothetical protein